MKYLSKFVFLSILLVNTPHISMAAEDINGRERAERLRQRRVWKAIQKEKIEQKLLEVKASQKSEKKKQSQKLYDRKDKRGHSFSKKQNHR